MPHFEELTEVEKAGKRREAAFQLTRMANGMVAVYGPEEALYQLMAITLATAEGTMSKGARVAWLRDMANTIERDEPAAGTA